MHPFRKSVDPCHFSLVLLILACFLVALPDALFAEENAGAPNILIVMTDDQGKWSLGQYDERIETPNIQFLAEQGVRFDQAISPTPVCSAARVSFYTGRTASQHGVHDFLSDKDSEQKSWLEDERLISEVLSDSGYRVGLFGKWHADTHGWEPAKGFDRWLTYDERGGVPWFNQYLHSGTVHFSKDGDPTTHTGVQARFLAESAVAFIDEPSDKPFAAFVNFVEPHFPFDGLPERLVERYRPIARDIVAPGDSASLKASGASAMPFDYVAAHTEKLAQYLAAVTLVDEQVGRLMDALEGRKLLENTLIVFTSDHGHQTGQYGLYGKGNSSVPQNLYEDAINIPLVIYGPRRLVARGQVRNEFVNLYDIFPTLSDVAGADLSAYDGPGKSLLPLLRGERLTSFRDFQFAEYGNARMTHNGRWKLIRRYQPDGSSEEQWYDLTHPLGERFPVPAPSEAQQEQLQEALSAFFDVYETTDHSGRRIWELPQQNAMEAWRH
ncbi:MAG: choline-sulfatase [Candidatus Azotimanducaceae bacterium]|jgi:choline-sulfatase